MENFDCDHPFWNRIGGVLVINMDSSPNRFEHMKATVGTLVPQGKWHRLPAANGRELPGFGKTPWFTERTGERSRFWGGTAGCAVSHRNAIEFAKRHRWSHVMILEDDARLSALPAEAWSMAASFIDRMQGEKYLFYLGGSRPVPYGRQVEKGGPCGIWQVDGLLGTYAYIVPASLYDDLLALFPRSEEDVWEWLSVYRAADVFYRDFVSALPGVRIFCVSPVLVEQDATDSVIAGVSVATNSDIGATPPKSTRCLKGVLHRLLYPYRRIKIRLNSIRTHRRALRGGLPGYKKRRS